MAVWRYSGCVVGVAQDILLCTRETANGVINVGRLCAPVPGPESIIVANALINSAPAMAGTSDPPPRQGLVKYIYGVSRAGDGRPAELLSKPEHWRPSIRLLAVQLDEQVCHQTFQAQQ